MSKEKLSMENLHPKLHECCYIAVGDYPTISQGSIKIVRNLLEQIQDELLEVIYDTEKRYVIKTFSKYLNEKGGK